MHGPASSARPVLVWRWPRPVLAAATAVLGGGVGERSWLINAQVGLDYDHQDPAAHLARVAADLGCEGDGLGLCTAASVARRSVASDEGCEAVVTVGLSHPTRAADAASAAAPFPAVGTINTVAWVPVMLEPGGLLNALTTATEAKVQALHDAGYAATGTASDAVAITCPAGGGTDRFGGPRSTWGARLARAVHAATAEGIEQWRSG